MPKIITIQGMEDRKVVSQQEWLAARFELLQAEKELTRRSDEVARQRQALPWVRIDQDYRFETDEGSAQLVNLFRGRSQLLIYHFMFGPDYEAGCPSCSAIMDGVNGVCFGGHCFGPVFAAGRPFRFLSGSSHTQLG